MQHFKGTALAHTYAALNLIQMPYFSKYSSTNTPFFLQHMFAWRSSEPGRRAYKPFFSFVFPLLLFFWRPRGEEVGEPD